LSGLDDFNELPAEVAEDALYACFANRRWASAMAAGRPYASRAAALEAADSAWSDISDIEWLAAFEAHPRIGERGGLAPSTSDREQSGVATADPETLAVLAAENREYEKRFGHVFLIAATGRTADEILQSLRERIGHAPAAELKAAAEEQRKITRLRLQDLLV
jgi:OHCU decarboxylase